MTSNFATNFLPPARSSSLPSNEGGDDIMDLDAIIEQLGQLESQLSYRESELQAATAANRMAEKSIQLDRELDSVLQELSNLESGEEYGGTCISYCPNEQFSSTAEGGASLQGSHAGYLTFEDYSPLLDLTESKNSFGTISSQSSHSSCASNGSAKSPQVLVRIYSPDGTCKTVAVDEQTTVGKVCQVLAKKHRLTMPLNWAIVECLPALHMERILEDHMLIVDQINLWTKDSTNRLLFVERPEKYSIFNDKEVKDAAANNSFSPAVDGFLHFKLEGKKTWKKLYFVLRASGLYYNPKGKGKAACDLICLQPLQGVDFYFGLDWRKNYKSPTDFGFAFKLPMVQKEVPKFVRFLCTEDKKTLMDWVTAFRLAKQGRQLYDSFVRAQNWSNSQRHELSVKGLNSAAAEVTGNPLRKGSTDTIPSPCRTASPVITESEGALTPVRKDSSDYGTLKKSIPKIPITTNLTRHLSLQQQNYAKTAPRQRPALHGLHEDDSPFLPLKDGNFMRFPSPDFSLDQPIIENGTSLPDTTATLPKRTPNKLLFTSESMQCTSTPRKYDTLSSRQLARSPLYERSLNLKSPSSGSSTYSPLLPFQMSPGGYFPTAGLPKTSGSSDAICDSYSCLSFTDSPLPHPPQPSIYHFPNQEPPLPPPPRSFLTAGGCNEVIASGQHLPLPPPPSELLSVDFTTSPQTPGPSSIGGYPKDGRRTHSSQPSGPPAPPTRSTETRLSIRRSQARTQHIIMDLDRVMTQKHEQGADGIVNLDIPLPPQPSFSDDCMDFIDPFDLPPPPAEILESLRHLRNRPLPPLPPGPPPIHRPAFSKVI